jgi:hypothetical protein
LPKFTGSTTIGNSALQETNGNLGLGVTPTAWDAGWLGGNTNTLEIGQLGSSFAAGAGGLLIGNNYVYNSGTNKYARSFPATYYIQNTSTGQHQWFNAPSGTAGNTITFTQAMTLTNGGNLLVGTTTDAGQRLQVSGQGAFTDSANGFNIDLVKTAGFGALIQLKNTSASSNELIRVVNASNTIISQIFPATNGIAITTGNVGIGTSSPTYVLDVYNDSASNARIRILGTTNFVLNQIQNTSGTLFMGIDSSTASGFGLGNYSRIIYSSNAYPLVFAVNDAERLRISSTGFVSAGATTNGRLGVRGFTNDSSGYSFEAANSSGNTLFIVRNDGVSTFTGNVGIGTYSPTTKLDVRGIVAAIAGSGSNGLLFGDYGTDAGTFSISAISGRNIVIRDEYAGAERMRITSGGNVLIGTTTNGARLTVQDAFNTFVGHFSGNNQTNGVAIGTNGSNVAVIQGYTRTFSATNNIAMQTDGGNLLVGTTTDVGATLHVNGAVRTGAPSGGSAVNWRLGTARAGTVTTNATVRVEIDGVLVDLVARYV